MFEYEYFSNYEKFEDVKSKIRKIIPHKDLINPKYSKFNEYETTLDYFFDKNENLFEVEEPFIFINAIIEQVSKYIKEDNYYTGDSFKVEIVSENINNGYIIIMGISQ